MKNIPVEDTAPRFERYRDSEAGVVCLAMDGNSTILYANKAFAKLLGCRTSDIRGRSLNEIAVNQKPHSEYTKNFENKKDSEKRRMNGGLAVKAYRQGGKKAGQKIWLNVYDTDIVSEAKSLYFVGYVRRSTWIERLIEQAGTGRRYKEIYKPKLLFFLSGQWRPWATAAATLSPIWMPLLVDRFPAIAEVLQNIMPGI